MDKVTKKRIGYITKAQKIALIDFVENLPPEDEIISEINFNQSSDLSIEFLSESFNEREENGTEMISTEPEIQSVQPNLIEPPVKSKF